MYKVLMCSDWEDVWDYEKNPEFKFFPKENLDKIESKFEVVWNKKGRRLTDEELIEIMPDIDAVFTCWDSNCFNEKILQHAPKLKVLAHMAGSVSPYVSPELYDRGIQDCKAFMEDKQYNEILNEFDDCVCFLSGQSGVGKSSLLNRLDSNLNFFFYNRLACDR